jgi:hypothetical protein
VKDVKSAETVYVTYDRWMAHIGLKGAEVRVFALVYGYFRNKCEYYGNLEYTAEMALCSRRTAARALDSLVKKGCLIKRVEPSSGAVKSCFYTINESYVKAAAEQYRAKSDTGECQKDTGECQKDTGECQKDTGECQKDTGECQKDTGECQKDTQYSRDTPDDNLSNNLDNKLPNTLGAGAGIFSGQNGKDEKPEQQDWCPFDEDKPLSPDECRRWAVKYWELCCKHWNRLGLKPECKIFFQIFPSDRAAEVIKIFQAYSLNEIRDAIANYKGHRGADAELYKPAVTFGSLATFLIGGVPRYYDAGAIDEQFEIKKGATK